MRGGAASLFRRAVQETLSLTPQTPPPTGKEHCVTFSVASHTYHATAKDAILLFEELALTKPTVDGQAVTLWAWDGEEWIEHDEVEIPATPQT